MVVAPALDWSPHRAKIVLAGTLVGAFVGGMMGGLLAPVRQGETRSDNGDIVAASMTAGLWGGFGLGVMMTRDSAPDPRFAQPSAPATPTAAATTSFVPWIGQQGQLGVMAGGAF
jgi:hypothetical protein